MDDDFSLYIFGAFDGRAVLHDIFLDGNTFTESHSIAKKNFYADIAGGITISYEKVMLSCTQVIRTEEFKGQRGSHSFGALALSYYFPFD